MVTAETVPSAAEKAAPPAELEALSLASIPRFPAWIIVGSRDSIRSCKRPVVAPRLAGSLAGCAERPSRSLSTLSVEQMVGRLAE